MIKTLPSPNRRGVGGEVRMKPRNIIIGQRVSPEKIKRAKELRSNMTSAEKILWEYLRAKRFNNLKFRRQQIIEGDRKSVV